MRRRPDSHRVASLRERPGNGRGLGGVGRSAVQDASERLSVLGSALDVDLPELRSEITQVEALVQDAVLQAQGAFYALAARVRRQRELVGELVASSERSGMPLSRFAEEALPMFERLALALHAESSGADAFLGDIQRSLVSVIEHFAEVDRAAGACGLARSPAREDDPMEVALAAVRACTCESALSVAARKVETMSTESQRANTRVIAALAAAERAVADLIVKVRLLGESDAATAGDARRVAKSALERLKSLDARLTCVLRELVESGAETDHHAATAVRALQFGDMVSQILACSRDRVARLERASTLVRSREPGAAKDVRESYANRVLRSPVTSADVTSGEVELF